MCHRKGFKKKNVHGQECYLRRQDIQRTTKTVILVHLTFYWNVLITILYEQAHY